MELYGLGDAYSGALGFSWIKREHQQSPRQIPFFECSVKKIACGAKFSAVLSNDGSLYTCGDGSFGQLCNGSKSSQYQLRLVGTGITDIAAGAEHMIAVASGHLVAWGRGKHGRLGTGSERDAAYATLVKTPFQQEFDSLACGLEHTVALLKDGTVWAFGNGFGGRLGLSSEQNQTIPKQVPLPTTIRSIACGGMHTCAIDINGRLYTWGQNFRGQLGHNDMQPRLSPCMLEMFHDQKIHVNSISCGFTFTCCVDLDGNLYGFGSNDYGELIFDASVLSQQLSPIKLKHPSADPIRWVVCGSFHAVSLTEKGLCHIWGAFTSEQQQKVEQGQSVCCAPTEIPFPNCEIKQVACGDKLAIALVSSQSCFSFSLNKLMKRQDASNYNPFLLKPENGLEEPAFVISHIESSSVKPLKDALLGFKDAVFHCSSVNGESKEIDSVMQLNPKTSDSAGCKIPEVIFTRNVPKSTPGILDYETDGHSQGVSSLGTTPLFLITGSRDGECRVWSRRTGLCRRVLRNHSDTISKILVSDDYLFTASFDATVTSYIISEIFRIHVKFSGHAGPVTDIKVTSKGLFSASQDRTVRQFNIQDGACLFVYEGHSNAIMCLLATEHFLLSGGTDWLTTVHSYNVKKPSGLMSVSKQEHSLHSYYCLSCLDDLVYAAGASGIIAVYQYNQPHHCIRQLDNRTYSTIVCMLLDAESKHLFVGQYQLCTRWDLDTKEFVLLRGHQDWVTTIGQNRNHLVTGSLDCTIRIWDKKTSECLRVMFGHEDGIRQLVVQDDWIYSVSDDQTARAWSIKRGSRRRVHTNIVQRINKEIMPGVLGPWSAFQMAVDYCQMAAFPFVSDFPWAESVQDSVKVTLPVFQLSVSIDYGFLLLWTYFAIALLILLCYSWPYLFLQAKRTSKDQSAIKYWFLLQWFGIAFCCQAMTTSLYIPFVRYLLLTFDCPNKHLKIGHYSYADECWTGSHLIISSISILALVVYLYLALRLFRVGSDITKIKWLKTPFHWHQDNVNATYEHLGSKIQGTENIVEPLAKAGLVGMSIYLQESQILQAASYLVVSVAFQASTCYYRPYFNRYMNIASSSLSAGLVWTNITALMTVLVANKENQISSWMFFGGIVPAVILGGAYMYRKTSSKIDLDATLNRGRSNKTASNTVATTVINSNSLWKGFCVQRDHKPIPMLLRVETIRATSGGIAFEGTIEWETLRGTITRTSGTLTSGRLNFAENELLKDTYAITPTFYNGRVAGKTISGTFRTIAEEDGAFYLQLDTDASESETTKLPNHSLPRKRLHLVKHTQDSRFDIEKTVYAINGEKVTLNADGDPLTMEDVEFEIESRGAVPKIAQVFNIKMTTKVATAAQVRILLKPGYAQPPEDFQPSDLVCITL
eukprot:TRINITY_DN6346_c0_g1_i30.p1 TRINITY_DN6346_c0_g1~~TRINITY_DN6346_c0_g1_i30.p1  ORF type:complete len:1382 (-),score=222.35 TRINITY_DN6346_c0_g1_i30:168-4313(-)